MPFKSKPEIHPETVSVPTPELELVTDEAPDQEPDEAPEQYYSVKTVHGNFQNAPIGIVPKVVSDSPLRAKVRKHAYDPQMPRGYDAAKVLLALEWETYSELLVALFQGGCCETELAAWESKIYVVTGTEFETTLTNPYALKCFRSGGSRTTQSRRLCTAFIEVYGDASAEQVLQRIIPHNSELNFTLSCHQALLGAFDHPKTRVVEVAA
jgi:hypothetical protein